MDERLEQERNHQIDAAAAGLAKALKEQHTHASIYLAELIQVDANDGMLFQYAKRLSAALGTDLTPNATYQAMVNAARTPGGHT